MQADSLFIERFSPYSFTKETMTKSQVTQLFDAARKAPSSFNEQPWRFIYAVRQEKEKFDLIINHLVEENQKWAKDASLLVLTFAKKTFTKNGNQYFHAHHDLGLAMGNFMVQATLLGLKTHHMGGILYEQIRNTFEIPKDFDILTAVAVGYSKEKHNNKQRKSIEKITTIGNHIANQLNK